jgi:endogenous inhibitor of DNA gyrase (YacG/DUF329 family)
MDEINCPECGSKVEIEIKHVPIEDIYVGKGTCPKCKTPIYYEDRRSIDQEGTVEVIFH